jgi:hypothetical protein
MAANSTRLASDKEKLDALAEANPGLIRVLSSEGSPPRRYILELQCRGVDRVAHGRAAFRDTHTIEVLLGPEYPFREPRVEFKTPIIHPHIWAHDNHVCLGDWRPAEFLDLLIKRLFGVIQYFPEYLDEGSVANHDAQDWVESNEDLLPLGSTVPGKAPVAPSRPRFIFKPE